MSFFEGITDQAELRKAFRIRENFVNHALIRTHHPDKGGDA